MSFPEVRQAADQTTQTNPERTKNKRKITKTKRTKRIKSKRKISIKSLKK